ncbi:capsule biosynthesis protein [Aeromonas caviae]|uniref:capsule biosynthesis protein n=1 Tax=Aeromonas caviae TaxID=648 RepID=UPI001FBAFADF|nr:capsular biosynthesis protein [Aeromonas caviae]GKR23702.1 capsule polysaccharide transporter [Aeromonas caviae]GKR27919.1 capsule polysaccharide transporter [Aeromonas caviae]GKR32328.1 capsule polysaccharide transporter [Aeromonas caviae]GKR61750.1 capsule polysaccharide transporter [Aeromonas caviae]GKR66220.1 capsule polysaccharide transporter [Aeromonas caviae]
MPDFDFDQFSGKRIVLLQGPVGPFFRQLADALKAAGATVSKINFNAGDWFFFPRHAINYRGTMQAWPSWFRRFCENERVDAVLLFGDCRPIHRDAHAVAVDLGIDVGVFEEGYIRPNYVTLERHGVNGHSRLPRNAEAYHAQPACGYHEVEVGRTYWQMVWCGFRYFTAGALGALIFPHYRHHRPLALLEALPWLRSVWRKQWYRLAERSVFAELSSASSPPFFLVPLQVFNDAQIVEHSRYADVAEFIRETAISFATHAAKDALLVFKHHPMDRGYRDYASLIAQLNATLGTQGRIRYIHDQHLPSLLTSAQGVVVINSTVGLSAIAYGTATKVCGRAIYDIAGLSFQGALDAFWRAAHSARPDPELLARFQLHVIQRTQLNGSFYKPLRLSSAVAGLLWPSARTSPPQNTAQ